MKEISYWPVRTDIWKFIFFFVFIFTILIIRYFETNKIENIYGSLLMLVYTILSLNCFRKRKILISDDQIEIPINLLSPKSTKIFKFQQIKNLKEKYIFDRPILIINGKCNIVAAYVEEEKYFEIKKTLEIKTNISIQFESPTKNPKLRFLCFMWFLITAFSCYVFFSKINNTSKNWGLLLILIAVGTFSIFIVYKFLPIPPTQRK